MTDDLYQDKQESLYIIDINNIGTIIERFLIDNEYEDYELFRDRILYSLVSEILIDEMGANLISIDNYNKNKLELIKLSSDFKIWKDYLIKHIISVVVVDLNLLYYVDVMVNKASLYIKLEEHI